MGLSLVAEGVTQQVGQMCLLWTNSKMCKEVGKLIEVK